MPASLHSARWVGSWLLYALCGGGVSVHRLPLVLAKKSAVFVSSPSPALSLSLSLSFLMSNKHTTSSTTSTTATSHDDDNESWQKKNAPVIRQRQSLLGGHPQIPAAPRAKSDYGVPLWGPTRSRPVGEVWPCGRVFLRPALRCFAGIPCRSLQLLGSAISCPRVLETSTPPLLSHASLFVGFQPHPGRGTSESVAACGLGKLRWSAAHLIYFTVNLSMNIPESGSLGSASFPNRGRNNVFAFGP